MASPKKKFHLLEIDLARAATAPAHRRKALIKAATGGRGYPFYKGFRSNFRTIFGVPLNPLLPAPPATKEQIIAAIGRICGHARGEIKRNKIIGEALIDYVAAHNVTAAEFVLSPVVLGRAGKRQFWEPLILKIDGKKYIPFFDPRQDDGLTIDARCFVFSINHTHIRLANPTEWGDVGFVIFQFDDSSKDSSKVIAHFDEGIKFWNDKEIGVMIDEVYRVLDDIRKAA